MGWPSLNSHRLDVRLDPDWLRCLLDACDSNIVVECVPLADEAFSHSSSDFVTEAATNSVDRSWTAAVAGMNETARNSWLLVYWMGRWMDIGHLITSWTGYVLWSSTHRRMNTS